MSSTDRQNRLLAAEDWKRVYQSFRNAEFKSYDFDNLRRTMINYLRENYPEDFNDYIESSEYLALIDMIAFLGQNFAFRVDLNARENYIDLAERRESVLRLARLLSYNPKRNQAANGLLKIDSVTTSEAVRDSNNANLSNQTIVWNDPTNPNWNEQFRRVLNAALPENGRLGSPVKSETIQGIPTQKYRFNATNSSVPAYSFSKVVDGRTVAFEIVSTDFDELDILEEAPLSGNSLAFLYREDGQGAASSNTGYFLHFRQGALDVGNFSIDNPVANQSVGIDARNVNNTDVWLYSLNENNEETELWTRVDAVEGNNVIYNSLSKNLRNIYSVLTRAEDRISLIFADGTFGNLPNGNFRVYYRTSINSQLLITPENMRGISVTIPYVSRTGSAENLTLTLSLKYTVDNASPTETNQSIRRNAPAAYYTQNRMITGEDYQVAPLTVSQEIVKAKSVNRTSSGISRYFDLVDATGKYSTVNLFGTDGALYKQYSNPAVTFTFENLTDIEGRIVNIVEPLLDSEKVKNYYLDRFPRLFVEDLGGVWQKVDDLTNQSTGFLQNETGIKAKLSSFTGSNFRFVKPDSLLKFEAPDGFHFLNGELVTGAPDFRGGSDKLWTKVVSILGDGTEIQETGQGPVILNDIVPTGAILTQIRTDLPNSLTDEILQQVVDQIFSYRTFGLRYDQNRGEWRIITANNLNTQSAFSVGKTGDATNQNLDASWLFLFETDGENYTVTYRALTYIFESDKEIRFYFDEDSKNFNPKAGKVQRDRISILPINNKPDSSEPLSIQYDWKVVAEYRDQKGYVNSKKLEIGFFDSDEDGIVDNPETFEDLVNETQNPTDKLVFLEKITSSTGVNDYIYTTREDIGVIVLGSKAELAPLSSYDDGQLFYYLEENIFEVFNRSRVTLELTDNYRADIGIDDIKFQYVHSTGENARIDPSASNIVDTYLLTRQYDTQFRQWLADVINDQPLPPSSDSLFVNYGAALNQIKSLSDEIIYHPVKYKVLFGQKARPDLQARFKIVKNTDEVINDNELKSRVISAINRYFSLDNWDFGDTFYFSELSAFVINELLPDLVTFVLVPVQADQSFGSLYEVKSESDEIFISGATVADIDIIDEITAERLRAAGTVLTQTENNTQGIQSSTYISSTTGGLNTNGI